MAYDIDEELTSLKDLINEDLIKLDVHVKNREEAILFGCNLLVEHSIATNEYCKLILKTLDKYGPYFVIAPHFALSHAKPENECVKKVGMSYIRLNPPIYFGNKENDPVEMVITLATPDNHSHVKALAELSKLLIEESNFKCLREGTVKEILDLIKNFSSE